MNKIIPRLIWIAAALCYFGNCARAGTPDAKVDTFYSSIDAKFTCGMSMMGAELDFDKSFPVENQADVLAELIERASTVPKDSPVIENAMGLVSRKRQDGTSPWNPRLKAAVLAQFHNPEPQIRQEVVDILFAHPKEGYHDTILAALKDEDDQVRQRVIDGVIRGNWPDTHEICAEYVKSTQAGGKFKDSVLRAKGITNPEDLQRSQAIAQKQNAPHALHDYLSYISLHKDDPDFEISVDTAERFSKQIQEDLGFYKSKPEHASSEVAIKGNPKVISKFGSINAIDMDDWGNERGINGEMTYGEYGTYQFRIKGASGDGTVRANWHYQGYQFEVTRIDEISSTGSLTALWTK